jgi:hypothetical protein
MPEVPQHPKAASSDLDSATVSAMHDPNEVPNAMRASSLHWASGSAGRRGVAGLALWVLLALVLSAGSALAHPVTPHGEIRARDDAALELTVTVILAKKGEARPIPAELKPLERYLVGSFKGYGDFSRVARHLVTVRGGQPSSVQLPNGTTLALRHDGVRDGYHHLHLEVGGLKTTVHVTPGATFFQAGRAWEGGMMVLAFEAAR